MKSDNVSVKGTAKSRIINTVVGFLLLLSIYTLLRTINPDLLLVNPDISGILAAGQDGEGTPVKDNAPTPPKDNLPAWAQEHGSAVTISLPTGGTKEIKGCETTNMVTVNLFTRNFTVHKSMLSSLKKIDAAWKQKGGNSFYKIPASQSSAGAMGAYSCRTVRGNDKVLSNHAYGLAIDINPAENPLTSSLKTDMPTAFIQLWKAEGWGWGGDWSSKKDPMHFSKLKKEGGDEKASDAF